MHRYIKKIMLMVAVLAILTSQLGGTQGVQAATSKISVSLSSKRAIIIDMDSGKTLYSKNAKQKCHNASTTKLMTAIVAVEQNKSLKKKIKISDKASSPAGGPTSVRLEMRAGDRYYLKDLLHGMLIKSANDAAVAIAEGTSGSVNKFMKQVNKKAKKIGCKNTVFGTPNGLQSSKTHYTTAYDMAQIMKYAYQNKTLRNIMKKQRYSFKSLGGRKHSVTSTNLLLKNKTYYCVGKTGYGSTADYCYTGVYTYKGHSYVLVAFGSGSEGARWSDAKKMISACKKNAKEVAKSLALNQTSLELQVGEVAQLKVKRTKGSVKWSVKNSNIVTVDKKGVITAQGQGSTTVYAKVYGRTLKCKVCVTQGIAE